MSATTERPGTMTDPSTTGEPGTVVRGRFRTGVRIEVPYDNSWLIIASRRDLAWQRARYAAAGALMFSAGAALAAARVRGVL